MPTSAEDLRLCKALGLDPAKVVRFEWTEYMQPGTVNVVFLGSPLPDQDGYYTHTRVYDLPEGWR